MSLNSLATHTVAFGRAAAARIRAASAWLISTTPVVAQSMVEYAIIAALVAVVAVIAVRSVGQGVGSAFVKVDSAVQTANDAPQAGGGN